MIWTLCNVWTTFEYTPRRVKTGDVVSISKLSKGEVPTRPGQSRPIPLLPVIFKVYERVIKNLLDTWHVEEKLHRCQCGFRRKRGCHEQLATLREVSQKCQQHNDGKGKPMYIASLDIRKAYKLKNDFGVPDRICCLIHRLYQNTGSKIRNGRYATHDFDTTTGVVQGSVLSPILYGVYMNDLICKLDDAGCTCQRAARQAKEHDAHCIRLGVHVNNTFVSILAYCDDLILMAESMLDT